MKYAKRHYEDVACILHDEEKYTSRNGADAETWLRIRRDFITLFKADNPRFDVVRFKEATGRPQDICE